MSESTRPRALVTGAARRLGRHLAVALAREGYDIVIHYRGDRDAAESSAEAVREAGGGAALVAADFASTGGATEMVRSILAENDRLDVVVNNVGNYIVKPVEETTEEEWAELLQVNLTAAVAVMRGAMPALERTRGSVINIGYVGSDRISANSMATAYQVTKTGLLLATRAYAERFASKGVRVNMISPGHLENSIDLPDDIGAAIPMGRAGRLVDVERAMLYLLEDDGYVTGQNLDVAGGYRLG